MELKFQAGVVLGVPLDHYTYKDYLYNSVYDDENIHLMQTGKLEKQFDADLFTSVQKILSIHRGNCLTGNRLIAHIVGTRLLQFRCEEQQVATRAAYMDVINVFEQNHETLAHKDFGRVFTDIFKWSWAYLTDWEPAKDSVIWYGAATKSEVYFLYFLYRLGFDVLIFHPMGINIFEGIEGIELPIQTLQTTTTSLEPFPSTKPARQATIATRASSELEQMMKTEGSYLYKPWQFRDYMPKSLTLHTTYDEVRLIMRENAFVRQGFEVGTNVIQIPVIFAKICGVTKMRDAYAELYQELSTAGDMTLVQNTFPFTKEEKVIHKYHYEQAKTDGILDPQKMVVSNWWRYKHLPIGLQLGLASAISRYVDKAALKAAGVECVDDIKQYLFAQALKLPDECLRLLQKFDYAQSVPRLILFNTSEEGKGQMSRSDAARLLLLNEIGFDIVLFNPTGRTDLELFLDTSLFDTHWLDEVEFDKGIQELTTLKPSFIKSIASRIFKFSALTLWPFIKILLVFLAVNMFVVFVYFVLRGLWLFLILLFRDTSTLGSVSAHLNIDIEI